MSDPFAIAATAIFNSPIAVSGVLTDINSNQYSVRCVVRTQIQQTFQGWNATLPENKTEIVVLKGSIGVELSRELLESIEVDGITYNIDGVTQDDGYTVALSVVEV